ncbi:magnesium transporter [Nannochloropsis oceanica]
MLFLRHIPQTSSESLEAASSSLSTSQHAYYRSAGAAAATGSRYNNNGIGGGGVGHHSVGHHSLNHLCHDEDGEDVSKIRSMHGRAAFISATKAWLRRAVDAVWIPGGSPAAAAAAAGGMGRGSSPSRHMKWRAASQDILGLSGSAGGANGAGDGLRYYKSPPSHYASFQQRQQLQQLQYRYHHPNPGYKVGPLLLAAHQNIGDAVRGGSGDGGGGDDNEQQQQQQQQHHHHHHQNRRQKLHEHMGLNAMDKVSINMTLAANLRAAAIEAGREGGTAGGGYGGREGAKECPVELIAPCAVPSASLKDYGALREEGLVVPSSFLVGDVVDFITRMSKLERYSGVGSGEGGSEGGIGGEARCRSLERIFVTDCGRLLGYVTSMDLLVQERTASLLGIVRPCEVLVKDTDEYDDAILAMRRKRLTYAPVVTKEEVVVGIITPSDMLNEMELEATDDVSRFSGSGRGSESFFGTSVLQVVTARASWLVSLLMLQSLSSIILTHFSVLIERHLVIALFLTMLTGTAGNAGNQSSAMVIRGIATGEINRKNSWRVVWREVKAALLMSVLLAVAAFVRVYITPGSTFMSTVAVTLALSVTVVGACAFGTVAPLVMDRLGVDPANCASPALSTIVDVGGVLVLCAISSVLLG